MSTEKFLFLQPNLESKTVNANDLIGKTTKEIAEKLQVKPEFLYIRTPLFRKKLQPSQKPFSEFPDLLLSSSIGLSRPTFLIEAYPELTTDLTIFVKVESNIDIEIPPFPVDIPSNRSLSLKNFFKDKKQLIQLLETAFTLPHENSDIIGNDPFKSNLIFKTTILPPAMKILKTRANIVHEIITTEESYIEILDRTLKFWQVKCSEQNLFNPNEMKILFSQQEGILQAHSMLLQHLKERSIGYSSLIGDVFIECAPSFKTSQVYVASYPKIIEIFKNLSKKVQNTLGELSRDFNGEDLQSCLITPLQRMPRYSLFCKQLLKYTPKCHPDFQLIGKACDSVQAVTEKFDEEARKYQDLAIMTDLQMKVKPEIQILDPARKIEFQGECTEPFANALKATFSFRSAILKVFCF